MSLSPSPGFAQGPQAQRVFHPRRSTPADVVRPTRAEISLPNLRHNLRVLARRTQAQIWCVLKADAYGHGAKACARTLERAGAAGVCVALVEEGVELRSAGITLPILVMGGYYARAYDELVEQQLTPVLCNVEQIRLYAEEARHRGLARVPAHIKFDTGMARLGFLPAQVDTCANALQEAPELHFEGLMTHFASSDRATVERQAAVFERVRAALDMRGLRPELRHAASTGAMLLHADAHYDAVRPGLGVFGVEPEADTAPDLRPAMRVLTTVVALRDLPAGAAVGYSGIWRAPGPARIATIPMGYADGLSRLNSNVGYVLIRGMRAPIVGAVSMDMTTVDVSAIPEVSLGDEVVVLGSQRLPVGTEHSAGQEIQCISASELADREGTIPWEVLTNISRRVPRFYREA